MILCGQWVAKSVKTLLGPKLTYKNTPFLRGLNKGDNPGTGNPAGF